MATWLIRIQLLLDGSNAYPLLEISMQKENFIPAKDSGTAEKIFYYYGNQDFSGVNEAVQRAAIITGKRFGYTISKDKRLEKQYHALEQTG